MIWIWIVIAMFISWLFCERKIGWYHYIWLLLPVEMYGITVAGATIKPYMIFGMCIIIADFLKKKTIRVHVSIIIAIFALVLSDFLTGFFMGSVMQHIMFIVVLLIGYCYQDYQSRGIEFDEIGEAALATTIGYGIVFTVAEVIFTQGISLAGIYATERLNTGMVLRLASFGGNVSSRLRGFCIDPNSVIITLIPGAAFAMANLVQCKQKKIKSLLGIGVYFAVVLFSGSRMALICSFLMLVTFCCIGYKKARNKKRIAIIGSLFVCIMLFICIINLDMLISEIAKAWVDMFAERASFDSEYGRLTIWKTNIMYLFENNKEWIGVGQNQIYLLTEKGLACHNTWLEWICGTGLIIGLIIDLWFILAPVRLKKRTMAMDVNDVKDTLPAVLSYVTVLICISTVDNITNSVLLFLMLIFRYGVINENFLTERII